MMNKPKTSDVNPKKGQNAQGAPIGATLPVTFWYKSETQSSCRKSSLWQCFVSLYKFSALYKLCVWTHPYNHTGLEQHEGE